jgi:hypothetical protein
LNRGRPRFIDLRSLARITTEIPIKHYVICEEKTRECKPSRLQIERNDFIDTPAGLGRLQEPASGSKKKVGNQATTPHNVTTPHFLT